MSQAMRCDRCKNYFDKNELVGEQAASFSYTTYDETNAKEQGYKIRMSGHFDLCPKCTEKLFEWAGINVEMESFYDAVPVTSGASCNPFDGAIQGFLNIHDDTISSNDNKPSSVTRKRAEKWSW